MIHVSVLFNIFLINKKKKKAPVDIYVSTDDEFLENSLSGKHSESMIKIYLWACKPEDLNGILKISLDHLCLMKENRNFYIIITLFRNLSISIMNICNKPCQCRNADYGADDTPAD